MRLKQFFDSERARVCYELHFHLRYACVYMRVCVYGVCARVRVTVCTHMLVCVCIRVSSTTTLGVYMCVTVCYVLRLQLRSVHVCAVCITSILDVCL